MVATDLCLAHPVGGSSVSRDCPEVHRTNLIFAGVRGNATMNASSSILNPPAHTNRRSVLRQFIDAVIEGRRCKAQHELALYLEHHKHSLKDDVRIELENRLRGQ